MHIFLVLFVIVYCCFHNKHIYLLINAQNVFFSVIRSLLYTTQPDIQRILYTLTFWRIGSSFISFTRYFFYSFHSSTCVCLFRLAKATTLMYTFVVVVAIILFICTLYTFNFSLNSVVCVILLFHCFRLRYHRRRWRRVLCIECAMCIIMPSLCCTVSGWRIVGQFEFRFSYDWDTKLTKREFEFELSQKLIFFYYKKNCWLFFSKSYNSKKTLFLIHYKIWFLHLFLLPFNLFWVSLKFIQFSWFHLLCGDCVLKWIYFGFYYKYILKRAELKTILSREKPIFFI